MHFKIDWVSLIVGRKFTIFALFYFVFEGNFQVQAPGGAYVWRGDLTEGFLRYEFRGLIFGGAYTWRGLFSEFYGIVLLLGVKTIVCYTEDFVTERFVILRLHCILCSSFSRYNSYCCLSHLQL